MATFVRIDVTKLFLIVAQIDGRIYRQKKKNGSKIRQAAAESDSTPALPTRCPLFIFQGVGNPTWIWC